MQNYHMDVRGWSDIAYNELACPHDFVFEGRGWDHQSAANGYESANEQSYALQAMWGSKAGAPVPKELKRALLFGVSLLRQHTSSKIIKGHRDWKSTDCPGDELYAWIQAGCPSPDPITLPSKDFDVATLAELEVIVQRYSAFNAENLRQRIDDIGKDAAARTDEAVQDDFVALGQMVLHLDQQMQSVTSKLDGIMQKLNTPS